MEVVGWPRLTAELGVVRTHLVAWHDAPELEAIARTAVEEQAAHDADADSDDDDDAEVDLGSQSDGTASGRRARSHVLWRRDGLDIPALLNVDDLRPLDQQARLAARGFRAVGGASA